ncbi:MAG: VTT domain-containing protein [Pseudomonadota bacterium]
MRTDLIVLLRRLLPFLLTVGAAMALVLWLAAEFDVLEGGFSALAARSALEAHALVLVLFVLATLTSVVPLSLLAISTGALFGWMHGFAVAAFCLMISAGPPYFLARRLLRGEVQQLARHFIDIDALNREIAARGTQVALLLRLSPVAPFGVTSYIFGLTEIGPRSHFIAVLATYPALFGTVLSGHLAAQALAQSDELAAWQTATLVLGALATLAAVVVIGRIVSKQIGSVVK